MTKHKPVVSVAAAPSGTRLSVTLPAAHYRQMKQVAAKKKVSVAWVMRDAVDQYLAAHGDPASGAQSGRRAG